MAERIKVFSFSILVLLLFSYSLNYIGSLETENANSNRITDSQLIPIMVIDAGHGGSDGGTVAVDGTNEAIINLDIAEKLNDYLSFFGFETEMTRKDENSIGEKDSSIRSEKVSDIHKRMDIMNSFDNCVFISIHQNFYEGSSSWGTQVFYSANNPESEMIAKSIQENVVSLIQPENTRQIKKSGSSIYLLYKAVKPAVMVECGFLSNKDDTSKLKDEVYQNKMAYSIALGIINYLEVKGA